MIITCTIVLLYYVGKKLRLGAKQRALCNFPVAALPLCQGFKGTPPFFGKRKKNSLENTRKCIKFQKFLRKIFCKIFHSLFNYNG